MPAPYSRFYAIDMDYCQISLHEYIYATERWKISNPLPLAEHPGTVFGIMMHISEGLAFIHENRYIHRNLVPRNSTFPHSYFT
jgi:serine/threonine protein kinase